MRALLSEQPPPRKAALLRVPFIRRCDLDFGDGAPQTAFIVNINLSGVYIAADELPQLGQGVHLRFSVPDSEREVSVDGAVAWLNPKQQHPVHSLPPGFGVQFRDLSDDDALTIERVIMDYKDRQPSGG